MPRKSRPIPDELRAFVAYLWSRTRAGHKDPLSASAAASYQSALVLMHQRGGFKDPEEYVEKLALDGHPDSAKLASTAHKSWSRWFHAQPENAPTPAADPAPAPVPVVMRPEDRPFTPLIPPPPPVLPARRRKAEWSPLAQQMLRALKAAHMGGERELSATPWANVTDSAHEGIPGTGPGLCLRVGAGRLFIPCASQEEVDQVIRDASVRPHAFIIEE